MSIVMKQLNKITLRFAVCFSMFCTSLLSCSLNKKISTQANKLLIKDTSLSNAFVGISIYNPDEKTFLYNYNAEKYFIPASNTKLFTLYTALKYLGDSLTAIKYCEQQDTLYLLPTGDPSFLKKEFTFQPFADFLSVQKKPIVIVSQPFKAEKYGKGWAWDDYNEYFMPERNALPIYGNVFSLEYNPLKTAPIEKNNPLKFISPELPETTVKYTLDTTAEKLSLIRNNSANTFEVLSNGHPEKTVQEIPFITNGINAAIAFLKNKFPTLQLSYGERNNPCNWRVMKSQPTDSVLKRMMNRSDNFLAEQLLLMASNERLGYMSDRDFIDTVLKTDLKNLPQQPQWIDGSGLSRYNLTTPQSIISIIDKMKNEFGTDRLKNIFITGGEGTLKNYFIDDSSFIFAKTGTLSNNCSLSGWVYTKKGKCYIFSVLANHYPGNTSTVRRAVEKFIKNIRKDF